VASATTRRSSSSGRFSRASSWSVAVRNRESRGRPMTRRWSVRTITAPCSPTRRRVVKAEMSVSRRSTPTTRTGPSRPSNATAAVIPGALAV
jgi:hypothetical protein